MRRLVSRLILTRQEHDKEKVSAYYKSSSLFECSICLQCYLFMYWFICLTICRLFIILDCRSDTCIWSGSTLRSNPLPFHIHFWQQWYPFLARPPCKSHNIEYTRPSGRPHPSNLLGTLTICRRRWRMRGEVNTRCWSLLKDIPKFLFYRRFVLYMYFSC